MITSGSFAKALWPGVKKFHGDAYSEHKTEYTEIFKKETSTKLYEEYVMTTGFGLAPRKQEGGSISYDDSRQLWTTRATNVVYGIGFTITREMIDDDQYSVISRRKSRALAFSMRQTKEIVGANVLNRAFNSSYTFGDGLELCSTAHLLDGGTFNNELDTASDLNEDALEQAAIDIMDFTDARGLKINIKPRKLIVPPALWADAERLLKSQLQVDTQSNNINVIRSSGLLPEGYKINHYLTDSDAWFIVTDAPEQLVYQERDADEFSPGENDFDTENARFKARGRYTFAAPEPRAIFGSPGG